MEFKVEKQGSCLSKLTITVPAKDVDAAFDKATRKLTKKAEIPGYRPGKVPKQLIERQYSQQILQEAMDAVVRATLFTAIEQAKLIAVAMPTLDFKTPVRGADFVYTADVEVQPEIVLSQTEGLTVPPLKVDEKPEAVDEAIEQMRTQGAQTVPVTDRTTVQMNDHVLLDYAGTIDNTPFPGGKAANAMVEVLAGEYIPGFAEGLVGAEVPGEVDVPVTFPADYGATHLAGKEAVFHMTLKELKVRQLPELDEEFAKDMGHDSLAALRTSVAERLSSQAKREAENTRRRALLEALIAANPFELPPAMVDNQVERIITETNERMTRMTGKKAALGPDELADIRASSRDDAEFQVRSGMLLMAVSKQANIEIDDAAIDAEVERLATSNPAQADNIRNTYKDDADRRDELRFRLLEEQVITGLYDKSVAPSA